MPSTPVARPVGSSSTNNTARGSLEFAAQAPVKDYKSCNKPGAKPKHRLAVPLGEGGSGVVYLVEQTLHQKLFIHRAIKFFAYRGDIAKRLKKKGTASVSQREFLTEISNTIRFSHENLVKVVDAGLHENHGFAIPYIVTEFIAGITLEELLDKHASAESLQIRATITERPEFILELLSQIANGLRCLHDQFFVHCDIAPKNIFLKRDEEYKAVIADLGVGHNLKRGTRPIKVLGTKTYMPPEVLKFADKTVHKSVLRRLQPFWDQYAFAKVGLEVSELLPPGRFIPWREPLIATLKDYQQNSARKTTVSLAERLHWLHPSNRTTAGVPELSHTRTHLQPIAPVVMTDRFEQLIRHPALLRLSRVKQLTSANQVFPGAQNTRYEHSLGVLETMRRYIIHLVSRGDFLTHLSSSSIETALVCALLFNITRLPLATVLEELDAIPGHELFTKESLLSEIFRIRDRKANTIPMVIRKLFPQVHIERIENILLGNNGSFSDQDALIYSLLNCSLDVRVVDYVRRDAHHLGLGRVFDLSELLPHLRVYQHRLALDITGVSVAEEIVNLRYTLYNRIYWSRPNRAFVAMLKHVVTSLASTNIMRQLRTTALRDSEQGMITFLTKAAQAEGDVICNDIMRLLSMDRDRLYKVIVQVSPKEDSELSIVCQRVGQMSHAELRRLSWNVSEALRLRSEWRLPIIIDMPKESGTNTKLGDDILVLTADSSHCENLSHVSGIVRGVNESFNGYLRRMRVFVHPDVFPKESEARSDLKRRVVDTLLKLVV